MFRQESSRHFILAPLDRSDFRVHERESPDMTRFSRLGFQMRKEIMHSPAAEFARSAGWVRYGARVSGAGAIAAVTIVLLSTGAANADTFVPLPNGEKVNAEDGVKIDRFAESALISPSMSANGLGRVAWVSGTVVANVTTTPTVPGPGPFIIPPANTPGSNNSSVHGASQLNTGYIVGCQVAIGTSAISAGGGFNVSTTSVGANGSISLQLGPGQVMMVQTTYKDIFEPGTYSISYKDNQIDVEGCGGYAQARAYTNVDIFSNDYSRTTLYGQPFSIG
jgi:hypothetical protein